MEISKLVREKIIMQKGFTLLESMIALVILSIGLLGIWMMMGWAVSGNSFSAKLTQAESLAVERLEKIRGINYDYVHNDYFSTGSGNFGDSDGILRENYGGGNGGVYIDVNNNSIYDSGVDKNYPEFRRETCIYVDINNNGVCDGISEAQAAAVNTAILKNVEIRVFWKDSTGMEHKVEIRTMVSR